MRNNAAPTGVDSSVELDLKKATRDHECASRRCFVNVCRCHRRRVSLPRIGKRFHIVALQSAGRITAVCSGDALNLPSHYRRRKLHLHLAPFAPAGWAVRGKGKRRAGRLSMFTAIGLHVRPGPGPCPQRTAPLVSNPNLACG